MERVNHQWCQRIQPSSRNGTLGSNPEDPGDANPQYSRSAFVGCKCDIEEEHFATYLRNYDLSHDVVHLAALQVGIDLRHPR